MFKRKRRRMPTSKKALWLFVTWCLVIQIFCLVMIWRTGDSNSLAIFAGSSTAELIAVYKIYSDNSKAEKIKHMEMNYDPNYNENHGIK